MTVNLTESEAAKREGLERVTRANQLWLEQMRAEAVQIARAHGVVHANHLIDCAEALRLAGLVPTSPNAWGAIFRCPLFRFTGERVKSALVSDHARELKVWALA